MLATEEYIQLADKALRLFGTPPTVWLLVQLHQMGCLQLYSLPTNTSDGSSRHGFSSPQKTGKQSVTNTAKLLTGCDGKDCFGSLDNVQGAQKAEQHNSAGPNSTCDSVILGGMSVDLAIVVVLTWAAQLAASEEACSLIKKAGTIVFKLGKLLTFCSPVPVACRSHAHCCTCNLFGSLQPIAPVALLLSAMAHTQA